MERRLKPPAAAGPSSDGAVNADAVAPGGSIFSIDAGCHRLTSMPNVSLTPELDAFAAACVASGRYANVSEVHRAALRLLQEREQRRQAFGAMLQAAEQEGETQGFLPAGEVLEELDELIAAAATHR